MLLSCSVLSGGIFPCPPSAFSRCCGDPEPRPNNLTVKTNNLADRPVDVGGRHFLERMAGGGIGQISHAVAAMEGVDRGRKTGGFPGKTGQHKIAASSADD